MQSMYSVVTADWAILWEKGVYTTFDKNYEISPQKRIFLNLITDKLITEKMQNTFL